MRTFTLFAFFIAAVAPTSAFAQARGRQHGPAILYPPLPDTLKGLWDAAPVVLRARIETVGSPLLSPRMLVERLHGLRVVELLKGPSDFPKTFRLSLPGGTVSVDGVEHVTDYERDMVDVGDEALLFLIPMPKTGVYAPAFGPAGFFALSHVRDPSQPMGSTRVTIPPRAQRIREFAGRTSIELEELAQILRRYREKRPFGPEDVGGAGLLDGAQVKPTREMRIHEDGGRGLRPSADLDELWKMSDLVVRATYIDARPNNLVLTFPPPEPDATLVRTALRFQVVEVFKPRLVTFQDFEISRAGGTLRSDREVVRYINDKFPDFEQGQQYVLFLKRRDDGMYVAASGSPDSEFRLAGNDGRGPRPHGARDGAR